MSTPINEVVKNVSKATTPNQTMKLQNESKASTESNCTTCKGTGWYREDVPVGDPKFGKLQPCECQAKLRAERLQRNSGLSNSEQMIHLDDIDILNRPGTHLMVQACHGFIKYPYMILTIWGRPGNAKSRALFAIINHLKESNHEAVYVTLFDLLNHIREAFDQDRNVLDDNAYRRFKKYSEAKFLAIDEFDKVRVTDWTQEQLSELIDRRYRTALDGQTGTIIAMNNDPQKQPEHIWSRLNDGRMRIINNYDNDLRPLL